LGQLAPLEENNFNFRAVCLFFRDFCLVGENSYGWGLHFDELKNRHWGKLDENFQRE
jgi:hypothetical protein